MTYTVTVTNFSQTTTESQLHDFFSFCGKINKIDIKEKEAIIHFEKPASANTAALLNGGSLDGAHITVTTEHEHPESDSEHHDDHTTIDQSDKPRAGIAAEYLAKGYVLSDDILQRAIAMDNQKGISKRFLGYLNHLDTTLGAKVAGEGTTLSSHVQTKVSPIVSDVHSRVSPVVSGGVNRARTLDEQQGISRTATSYYQTAISSPLGKKVFAFYSSTTKQVVDIHEEARRIAAAQKGYSVPSSGASTTGENLPSFPAQPTEHVPALPAQSTAAPALPAQSSAAPPAFPA